MALKDTLKHFANMDGYATVLTKADFDSNIDTLANAIDTNSSNIDTKLDKIISINSGSFERYLQSATISTADDTQTIIASVANLPIKSIVNIDIYSQNLQDDYSTKWIFEGSVYANIKDDGTITVTNSLTDIVKDDTDWAFATAGNNGDSTGGASIDLKVTGKASTNIKWSVFLDIKVNKF